MKNHTETIRPTGSANSLNKRRVLALFRKNQNQNLIYPAVNA
jgi:hypothetical protein